MTWLLAALRAIPGLASALITGAVGLLGYGKGRIDQHNAGKLAAAEAEADNLRRMAKVEPTRPDAVEDALRRGEF